MEVTLHQLRIFVAVADSLSFSRAAHSLLLSQPAVSMQIKAMERGLGVKLFDHVGKRIYLTEPGKELQARAVELLGLSKAATEAMADLRYARVGRLRVVATTTVGIYVVPGLLGQYHRQYANVEIKLEVANWETTRERLFSGDADVAIAGPHRQSGIIMEPFMNDELVVIAAPDHRLAGQMAISLEELSAEPMIVREEGSGTRAALERLFEHGDLELRRAMELSRNGAVKQVVKAGLGLAVISRASLDLELATGQLCVLDVESFPIVRAWNIITRSGFAISPAAKAFCEVLKKDVANL
jgi:LysR family transcriptional regulator, low CO2-responsive transcriptional regulator